MRNWGRTFAAAVALFASAAAFGKETILVVGGHPDDLVGPTGLVLLLKDTFDIHLFDYTRGAYMQSNDSEIAKTRMAEEREACRIAGVTPHFGEEGDGQAFAGRETCEKLAKLMKELKPRCVILHWIVDAHRDHMMSAAATLKAIEMAGLEPEILFFEETWQSKNMPVHHLVDITDVWDKKVEIIRAYKCQNVNDAIVTNKFRDAKFRGSQLHPAEDGRVAEAYSHFQSLPRGRASVLSFLPPPQPLKEPASVKPPKPGQVVCR